MATPEKEPGSAHSLADEGRAVLLSAAESLRRVALTLGADFERAVRLILECRGKLVLTGVGKAGHIAGKVSATFASTGSESIFLHPSDALHGDLGRVGPDDVVLMFSNSGASEELMRLLPAIRGIGARLIALTSESTNPLGREVDVCLAFGRVDEAGHLGLAPTTSTTILLALGDALAMVAASQRQFSPADFARFHPAGTLGRSLMRVGEVMRKGEANPIVLDSEELHSVLHRMTATVGRPGAASVVDRNGKLVGFYTDGDLRRQMEMANVSGSLEGFLRKSIVACMTKNPLTIAADRLVSEALHIMRERRIDQLPVVDLEHRPIGLVDVQDLLDVKVFG